jgi:hypothetical protein
VIAYRATLDVPRELAQFTAVLLAAERRRRGTPRGSRALTCFWPAVLGLRWFRDRTAPDALARDHGISRATAYRYPEEVIEALSGQALDLREPWDEEGFVSAEDPRMADGIDVASELSGMWWPPQGNEPHELVVPFTQFPGLAPAGTEPLTPAERRAALDKVLAGIRERKGGTKNARIGLVAADHAADVLAVVGWGGVVSRVESLLTLTAIFRSWEDRFGARVIDVGYADLRLFVERPPRTLEAAQRVAAEQVFLATDCLDGCRSIPDLAPLLVNAPIWTFWWD